MVGHFFYLFLFYGNRGRRRWGRERNFRGGVGGRVIFELGREFLFYFRVIGGEGG